MDRYDLSTVKTVSDLIDILEEADPDSLILIEDPFYGDAYECTWAGIKPFHLDKNKGMEWRNPHVLAKPEDEEAGIEAILLTYYKGGG